MVRVELRLPEARLVRLVADDEVLDGRERPRDQGREVRELAGRDPRFGQRLRTLRKDVERDANAVGLRVLDRRREVVLAVDRGRVRGVPEERDPVLRQADVLHRVVEAGRDLGRRLRVVVRRADPDVRGRPWCQEQRSEHAYKRQPRGRWQSVPHQTLRIRIAERSGRRREPSPPRSGPDRRPEGPSLPRPRSPRHGPPRRRAPAC